MFKNLFKSKRKKADSKSLEDYLVDAIDAFEHGDYREAAKQFQVITKAFPNHPLANLMLGRALIELNEYELAINAFFEHLHNIPESTEALIYLGLIYYECGEIESAEERFAQALELRKESVLTRENLAIIHMASGDLDIAIDELLSIHEDKPADAVIIELIVIAFGRMGKWEAAKHYLSKMKTSEIACDQD